MVCPSCGAKDIVAPAADIVAPLLHIVAPLLRHCCLGAAAKRARIKAAPALACSLMLRLVVQSVCGCEGEGLMAGALDGATSSAPAIATSSAHARRPACHMSIAPVSAALSL